jgi:hypothetical protein
MVHKRLYVPAADGESQHKIPLIEKNSPFIVNQYFFHYK